MEEQAFVNKPSVYVINFNGLSHEGASEFGDIIMMTKGYMDIQNIEELKRKFDGFIDNARKGDYLILSGHAVLVGYVVLKWYLKFGDVNILYYMNREQRYEPVSFLGELNGKNQTTSKS